MRRTFTRVVSPLFGWDPEALAAIRRKLDRVLNQLKRQEESMATAQEALDQITREIEESRAEVAETLEAVQKTVTFIQGVPALVRTAVDEALANNPGADLSALTQLAAELDRQQGQLDEAQLAINGALSLSQAPAEVPPVTSTETQPLPPGALDQPVLADPGQVVSEQGTPDVPRASEESTTTTRTETTDDGTTPL